MEVLDNMGKTIGIDLGTTNSCVSVVEGGKPVMIPNEKGSRTTPSVVAFTREGEQLVGDTAVRQAITNSKRTVRSVKRHMGTDWKFEVDGKYYTPQEISSIILRRLKKDAENYLGGPVTDAVITVPAYFNDIQRQATKDAGRIAGLNVRRIINEPTSAALAYGLDNGVQQKIMVFDLGGGTFDVSIIEIGEGVIEVLATNGDNHLGGDDFDQRIIDHICDIIKKEHRTDVRSDPAAMQRIRDASEQAKKELSSTEQTTVVLPYLASSHGGVINFEYTLSRSKFNELTSDLVDRCSIPVRNALTDAGIAASELGKVILVGGSTRIPAVQDKVRSLTGIIPSKNINPDECVAQGAAAQGDTLSGSSMVQYGGSNILLLDVTPLSLSIETVGGVATRLVDRNTTLPIHYSQVFSTAAPYQRSVEINVLQGERPMARDNKSIGKFKLNGIKMAPAGVPQIEVTFDIDTNGILTVSAKDLDTGKAQSITITDNERMSDEEIRRAIDDARKYAESDGIRRELMNVGNDAAKAVSDAQRVLDESKKTMSKEDRKKLKEEIGELQKLISRSNPEKVSEADITSIKEKISCVRELTAKASGGQDDQR